MDLSEIIIQKICTEGVISFHDFMEMALYYPGLGYYTSAKGRIGTNGDYYTSSCLTCAFGAMIGRQLAEMWNILGERTFAIIEYGAGNGALCNDILQYLENHPEFYENLTYYIIEKSPVMRRKEKAHLDGKVQWRDSIKDIPEIIGCVLSNELLDNFSVHQVVMEDELMEVFVGYDNGYFEVLKPASEELREYLAELNIQLPTGYRTEINLEATHWIKDIATNLEKGYIITIDYGYDALQLYAERRCNGTLICYNKHNINDCPYDAVGEQDITSHVNFSALCHWGLKNNLDCCGYTNQADFLLSLGLADHLRKIVAQEPGNYINYKRAAFIKHKLIVDMGNRFKVLIQQKGIPVQELSGLKISNSTHLITFPKRLQL